jgi:beta-glucosidase
MTKQMTIIELVDAMTLADQISLLSGEDFWSLPAISRLSVGKLRVTDGPNGARGGGSLIGGVKAAAFPVGIAIGASWNVDLAEEIGSAIAEEVKSKGAHVSLAPTVNIHRTVTNGRNFECYSEDPVLTGKLASGYIRGMQAEGVSATIKHYAGNESEIQRTTINSVIDERALREIYLLPFEMAVKEAGTWGIMSSYNKLNGIYAAENHWLLTEVLRGEWGYDGIVMSDWFGSRSTEPTINAGLDLEMPGPSRDRGAKLTAAVEAGKVDPERIRVSALNILRLMERTGARTDHRPHEELADDRLEHRALIRRAGAEGTVLLKNDRNLLPLAKLGSGKIAVIGPNAKVAQIMGGGSAQLNAHYRISPWQGLANALGDESRLVYAQGADNNKFAPMLTGPFTAEYFASKDLSGPAVYTEIIENVQLFMIGQIGGGKVDPRAFSLRLSGTFMPVADGEHVAGIFSTGPARLFVDGVLIANAWNDWTQGTTFFEEGCDEVTGHVGLQEGHVHQVVIEFASKESANLTFSALQAGIGKPLGTEAILETVAAAEQAETAIIFAGRNGEWDTEGADLPNMKLPGLQDELIARVAAANPNTIVVLQTGTPVEMPWINAVPAVLQSWYPGQEAGNAIADVLFGGAGPGGRLPQTFPVKWADNPSHSQDPEIYPGLNGRVRYEEGLFIGYHHYEKHGIAPLFPFGHGLSYTSFSWSNLRLEVDGENVVVSLYVTNTGNRTGQEVVQIYVEDTAPILPRPRRHLKAFQKLTLIAGDTQTARLVLKPRDFALYDTKFGGWIARAGAFTIHAAASATDTRLSGPVSRTNEWREQVRA